jgi:sugar lactone lactonase YvrE
MEARYATSTGGASGLIGQDGAGFLGMGGAQLITAGNGQGLIGNAGGTLIGNAGGTLLAGGRIVASGGGNVVVPASLIGNAGGTLIGNDGATLIGQDGAGYNLLATGPSPAFGEVWKAAGMWLSVTDSRTGKTVPLGEDAEGKPVYAIYTNAEGRFEVHVPKEVAEFARVVVRPPDRLDSRLVMSVPAKMANGGAITVNEDVAAATDLIRYILASMIIETMEHPPDPNAAATGDTLKDAMREFAKMPTFQTFAKFGAERNVKGYPHDRKTDLGLLLADMIVGNSLDDFKLATKSVLKQDSEVVLTTREAERYIGANAMLSFVDVMKDFHTKVTKQVQDHHDDPSYLNSRPYVVEANLRRKAAGQPLYCIQRVADLQELMVQEYFATLDENKGNKAFDVLMDMQVEPVYLDVMRMMAESMAERLVLTIPQTVDDTLIANLTEGMNHYAAFMDGQQTRPAPTPAAVCEAPLPQAPPAEPARVVDTLAGRGPSGAGAEEGTANLAGFNAPSDVLVAPDNPQVLYVADAGNNKIRRITLDDAGRATVDTLAGSGTLGVWDGPADQARFDTPHHLAADAKGNLYVMDKSALRQIVFKDGKPASTRTLLAHKNVWPFLSTTPADYEPRGYMNGLTVGPDHYVYVADEAGNAILRLPPPVEGQVPTVERFIGNGLLARHEGTRDQMLVGFPRDVAFGPDHSLWILARSSVRLLPNLDDPQARSGLVAGGFGTSGDVDGFWGEAWFGLCSALAPMPDGSMAVADQNGNRIRRVWKEGWTHTIAGTGDLKQDESGDFTAPGGYKDGPAAAASFNAPAGVAVAPDGTIYVADSGNNAIRRIRAK